MKKFCAIILLGTLLATLTACSSSFICDLCGGEKTGKKHTNKESGIEMTVCDDCYKSVNELFGY